MLHEVVTHDRERLPGQQIARGFCHRRDCTLRLEMLEYAHIGFESATDPGCRLVTEVRSNVTPHLNATVRPPKLNLRVRKYEIAFLGGRLAWLGRVLDVVVVQVVN